MNTWWVTANDNPAGRNGGWHWDQFLRPRRPRKKAYWWGGPEWIRSPQSRALIAKMRRGDLVVAFQSSVGVVGFARLATDGYPADGSEGADCFDLKPSGSLRLASPVPFSVVRTLPAADEHFGFVKFHQGTVFRVSREGRRRLGLLAAAFNPRLARRCAALTK